MNNICVRYHLLKLYEVQNNLYRCIIPKEIEAVIKSLPTNNTRLFEYIILPDIQEVLISIPIKLFYKIEINGILPNYFMRPQLPWYLKHKKKKTKIELQTNFPHEHRCKILNKGLTKLDPIKQKDNPNWLGGLHPRDARMIQHIKIFN